MKIFRVICILALAIGLTGLAYAETQSVKISGDLTIRSLFRGDYDMDRHHTKQLMEPVLDPGQAVGGAVIHRSGQQDDWSSYFMTTAEVQIDADLTDNVAAVLRLFNQRDWDQRDKVISDRTAMDAGYTSNPDEFNVGLDLAYIELKEFLYSPLSLKIGRQDMWFGKGFVMGVHQRNPNNRHS